MPRQLRKTENGISTKSWHNLHAILATLTTIAFLSVNLSLLSRSHQYTPNNTITNHDDDVIMTTICNSSNFQTKPAVPLFIKWEHFLPQTHNLYFIQLGANVGKNVGSGDPIWEYVRPCHWSGAAVELVSNTYVQLKENYADVSDRVLTLNYGVSKERGYVSMMGLGGEMARIPQIVKEIPNNNDTTAYVEIVTIDDIWDKLRDRIPSTGVDILVLDVEGNEANILVHGGSGNGSGELPHPKPKRILFEIAHLSTPVRDEIDESLRAQGYRQSADLIHRDEFAIRNNMPAQDRLYELIE